MKGKDMLWILNLILKVWSYSPILALTDDADFVSFQIYKEKRSSDKRLRLSIINVLIGQNQVQLFSFQLPCKKSGRHCKFQFFRFFCLLDMEVFKLTEEKANQLKKDYTEHYNLLSEDERKIEKESLLNKLDYERGRIETSSNKMNVYTSILLVLIPITITFLDISQMVQFSIIEIVLFAFLCYGIINICAWLFQILKVQGINLSSFGDLKNAKDKKLESVLQIYYDWQQTRRKADLFVSFVLNAQECIIVIIVMFVAFFAANNIAKKPNAIELSTNEVHSFICEEIDTTYSKSSVEWYDTLYKLQTNAFSEVIVLYNDENYSKVEKEIEKFIDQDIVWIYDENIDLGTMKIVLKE